MSSNNVQRTASVFSLNSVEKCSEGITWKFSKSEGINVGRWVIKAKRVPLKRCDLSDDHVTLVANQRHKRQPSSKYFKSFFLVNAGRSHSNLVVIKICRDVVSTEHIAYDEL